MGHCDTFEEIKKEGDIRKDITKRMRVDYYDQQLSKESSFWAPIRKWEKRMGFVTPIIWFNVFFLFSLHAGVLMHLYYYICNGKRILMQTYIMGLIFYIMVGLGSGGAVHRLWSHRSYKVKRPLKIFLLICFATAGQNRVYDWVRDHRVHHKKTETSSDPHDATRGLFFSHIGWLMMKKHPHVIAEGAKVDMSDITGDPDIVFFDRYFNIFKNMWCFIIPTVLPVWIFGEELSAALLVTFVRYIVTLHGIWSTNSFAHMFGMRPYDKSIQPSDNIAVSLFSMGEGSHNYHHTFPWDYKSTEPPIFALTTIILDMLALTGLVYDMRTASPSLIKKISDEKGDKSREIGISFFLYKKYVPKN